MATTSEQSLCTTRRRQAESEKYHGGGNPCAELFRAYSRAGGPTEAGSSAFFGRGLLRIRSRRLGGQYFVNSSLAPVVLLRRRLRSVADVLKGIRCKGFTQSRWDALSGHWEAVYRHGPCGPIVFLSPWDRWIPRDLSRFLIPWDC